MLESKIEALRQRYCLPAHIRAHCDQVAKVADFLAVRMARFALPIDPVKVHAAAKLHDLLRVCDLKNWPPSGDFVHLADLNAENLRRWEEIRTLFRGKDHVQAGYEVLLAENEPEIAAMILRHNFRGILDPALAPRTLAEKVVYYADKRVAHDRIVSLSERFAEGARRHRLKSSAGNEDYTSEKIATKSDPDIAEAVHRVYDLEKELLDLARLSDPDFLEG